MRRALFGVLLVAVTATAEEDDFVQNPRYLSPSGEMCVVVREYPDVDDFDSSADPIETWLDEYPLETAEEEPEEPEPAPPGGAIYRIWPSGYRELLSEFEFGPDERHDSVLVTDDGHVVTYGPLFCEAKAGLLTIRAADGSIVRTLGVRDVLTPRDQQWLCRGKDDEVRFSVGETLRMTVLVTGGAWDEPGARHENIDIDLESGEVAAPHDRCPAALPVVAETEDARSRALMERAVVRVIPEYPELADEARVYLDVGVQVVVNPDGTVKAAEVTDPGPFGIEEAVKDAIMKWEFTPDTEPATGRFVFRFDIVRPLPVTIACRYPANR